MGSKQSSFILDTLHTIQDENPDNPYYTASDKNLEIWLAKTNTIYNDIMLPY